MRALFEPPTCDSYTRDHGPVGRGSAPSAVPDYASPSNYAAARRRRAANATLRVPDLEWSDRNEIDVVDRMLVFDLDEIIDNGSQLKKNRL